jgi:hypothetical protein
LKTNKSLSVSRVVTSKLIFVAIAISATCSTTGCIRRYARVIALSTPALARVEDATTGINYGPTPAYIDVTKKFFLLSSQKGSFLYRFTLERCDSLTKSVIVTNWGKSTPVGPQHVTSLDAELLNCK